MPAGKVAMVTGGSRGIGRNTVLRLANQGVHTIFTYNSSHAQAEEVVALTQKLLPLIKDGGRIVNISSGLARITMPNRIGYGPIKAAVEALTRYLAVELAPRRIVVNVVAPGAIATDFSGGIVRDNPHVNKAVSDRTALGRVGVAEDVGPVIAALLSDEFGWVNAQRIEVSGGMQI